MHCGICGNTKTEVRPCYISNTDRLTYNDRSKADFRVSGDTYICRLCADRLSPSFPNSDFITWAGTKCQECGQTAAFDGPIDNMPTGIVCGDCSSKYLCEMCFDEHHSGHQQIQLQPILDRLSKL